MNIKTRVRSTVMRHLSSARYLEKQRSQARKLREKHGQPATVHYFHQPDDPYSHLAVQKLDRLKAACDVIFQSHLVSRPAPEYLGSTDHFGDWARCDAASVAADYGVTFSPIVKTPTLEATKLADQSLAAHLDQEDFARVATAIGELLWSGQPIESQGTPGSGVLAVDKGNALRRSLGHYQGAMFYFDGEWFWGVDRIRLLEQRLIAEGYSRDGDALCVPEPMAEDSQGKNASDVLLEYFPSLRSPYTAIGHQRVLSLVARSGVTVQVRPVMPMLMRGIPAPREKQRYIMSDAGREGRAHNCPFGRIVDPFGKPVKRAFALFAGAAALHREMEFVTAYLSAAWFDGVDITTEKGLRQVAANAGFEWHALLKATQNTNWEAILADNLNTMLDDSLWGVPSFRVSGGNADHAYACWGQDRIWRVESEISRRL
jgi:2-hydroxychromene-2-carboxylate isomerase